LGRHHGGAAEWSEVEEASVEGSGAVGGGVWGAKWSGRAAIQAAEPAATRGRASRDSGDTWGGWGRSWLTVGQSGVWWSAVELKWWKQLA
jgi:hypothetical protein